MAMSTEDFLDRRHRRLRRRHQGDQALLRARPGRQRHRLRRHPAPLARARQPPRGGPAGLGRDSGDAGTGPSPGRAGPRLRHSAEPEPVDARRPLVAVDHDAHRGAARAGRHLLPDAGRVARFARRLGRALGHRRGRLDGHEARQGAAAASASRRIPTKPSTATCRATRSRRRWSITCCRSRRCRRGSSRTRSSLRPVQIPEEPHRAAAHRTSQALRDIFTQLRGRTGHDFSNYKRATVLRRIARRMGVHDIAGPLGLRPVRPRAPGRERRRC